MRPDFSTDVKTRRPAYADRTVRRQFQATGQPVSRTQASDTMTSRLPRYEAKCATQVLSMRVGAFAFRYQGNGTTPCQYIDTTRKAIDCATTLQLRVFTGSIARSANLPVFNLLRGRFSGFSPRRCDTLHRWGWNLARRRGQKVPSSVPNFTPIGATTRV